MMRRIRIAAAIGLAGLYAASCSRAAEPVEDRSAGDETPAVTPVDTPPVEAPTLGALAQADIEAGLGEEPGCSLIQDGRNLLSAIEGDAIAKPYGTVRHFEFADSGEGEAATDGQAGMARAEGDSEEPDADLEEGGRFVAGTISVAIVPTEPREEQIGAVRFRQVAVTVRERGVEAPARFAAEWHCGA